MKQNFFFLRLFMKYLFRYIIPNGTRCMYLNYVEFCDIICMIHVILQCIFTHIIRRWTVDGKFLIIRRILFLYQKDAKWTKGIVFNFATCSFVDGSEHLNILFHLHSSFKVKILWKWSDKFFLWKKKKKKNAFP